METQHDPVVSTPASPRPTTRFSPLRDLAPRASDYAGVRSSWKSDVIAGLTVGVVAVPLALAFGITTGLGADAGLITAIVAGLVAAVFGGSNVQVSGPTGAMTVVLVPDRRPLRRRGCVRRVDGGRRLARRRGRRPLRPIHRLHPVAGRRGVHRRHRGHHLPAAGAAGSRRRQAGRRQHRSCRGQGSCRFIWGRQRASDRIVVLVAADHDRPASRAPIAARITDRGRASRRSSPRRHRWMSHVSGRSRHLYRCRRCPTRHSRRSRICCLRGLPLRCSRRSRACCRRELPTA